jgi:hypothetical protein
MPYWKNEKPSLVGLNVRGDQQERLIGPGEVFEADEKDIPKGLLDAGWIKPSKTAPPARAPGAAIAQPGLGSSADQPRLVGVDPSPTDADAAASKVYEPGTSPAERAAKTAELERTQAEGAGTADKPADAPKPSDTPQGSADDKHEEAKSGFFSGKKK